MLLETTTYLGPARVIEVGAPHVRLALPDQEVSAILALSYHPVAGDLVLAIGQEEKFYVIGVIAGRGKTVIQTQGELELRAGTINLVADRVGIRAGKLELVARSVSERFGDVCRWVKGFFQVRAGRVRQVVEESYSLQAGRIVERAEKDVRIDGQKINLG